MRISLVCFPLLHGVEAQHCCVKDTKKHELLSMKKYKGKKAKCSSEDGVFPLLLFVGVRGCRSQLNVLIIVTGCGTFRSLTHSLFSLSLSLSKSFSLTLLSVTLSTCLTAISTSAFCNSKQNSS